MQSIRPTVLVNMVSADLWCLVTIRVPECCNAYERLCHDGAKGVIYARLESRIRSAQDLKISTEYCCWYEGLNLPVGIREVSVTPSASRRNIYYVKNYSAHVSMF